MTIQEYLEEYLANGILLAEVSWKEETLLGKPAARIAAMQQEAKDTMVTRFAAGEAALAELPGLQKQVAKLETSCRGHVRTIEDLTS